MNTMRLLSWSLSAVLLGSVVAGAQTPQSPQDGTAPTGADAPDSPQPIPRVTVTGKVPLADPTLPALPPDQFTDCMKQNGLDSFEHNGTAQLDPRLINICAARLAWEQRVVVEACINLDRKNGLPRVIQACTEALDKKIFQGPDRFYLLANRADAYFADGNKARALDDYNEAVKSAPKNAKLYYNRGVFYAAQSDREAALGDLSTALSIDPKFVAALRQRAKLYLIKDNFGGALADYSEAVRLAPKAADIRSERGYVYLRKKDYQSAVNDESQAIQLDPKLSRAYFLRGAAFGDLGNSAEALKDIVTAVGLDPSLDRYISSKGKTASITLPPL
jgi:tetratricopeptide (TPR) repeat protein